MAAPTFGRKTLVKFVFGQIWVRDAGTPIATMSKEIAAIGQRSRDLTEPFHAFAPIWFEQERQVFAAEGLPTRWPDLEYHYASWKEAHFPGRPILVRSGRLRSSLVGYTSDTIYEAHPRSLQIGTRVRYSGTHTFGYKSVPARPHIVLLPDTFERLAQVSFDYIAHGGGRRVR